MTRLIPGTIIKVSPSGNVSLPAIPFDVPPEPPRKVSASPVRLLPGRGPLEPLPKITMEGGRK